nr:hypothetical protein [Bacteroidota bacterium]
MKKVILHIFLLVLTGSFLRAQIPVDDENTGFLKNLTEQVYIYTDRNMYLSGEEVWFTAYVVINNTFPVFDLSKIIYLELFDATKKKIFKGKFEVLEGLAAGSFQIPVETTTGNYFIRAYTKYQRNFSPGYYTTKLITIINPEFPLPGQEQIADTLTREKEALGLPIWGSKDEIVVMIQADKSVYRKREPVELKIHLPDILPKEIEGLSVSVARRGTLSQPNGFFTSIPDRSAYLEEDLNKLFWIPETRGVSISGIVTLNKPLKPLVGVSVYLSVLGDNPQMHITQTKENGVFIFSLGYLTHVHEIFIGVEPDDEKEIMLLVNNDFSNDFTHLQNIPVSIDTTYKMLIEEMLVNYQSQKIFAAPKTEATDTTQTSVEIFGRPEVSVRLADYIDLPNLENIFFELVPTAIIRNTDGRKVLYVLNPETNRIFTNQLLLFDHVPVFDIDAVLSIPPAKIEKIDVINRTHYFGDNILRSMVMMNSKAGDFGGYIFPEGSKFIDYQTITRGKKFEAPTYESQSKKNSRIPDFRTLLYWNPEVSISQGDTTLSFYTSDNKGDYDIIVRGVTKNGKTCFGKGSITIQ